MTSLAPAPQHVKVRPVYWRLPPPPLGIFVVLAMSELGWYLRCSLCDRTRPHDGKGVDTFLRDHHHGEDRARPGDAS